MAAQTIVIKIPCFAIFACFAVKSANNLSTFSYIFMQRPFPYPAYPQDAGLASESSSFLFSP
jgi:hypothetical protein